MFLNLPIQVKVCLGVKLWMCLFHWERGIGGVANFAFVVGQMELVDDFVTLAPRLIHWWWKWQRILRHLQSTEVTHVVVRYENFF